MGFYKSPSKTKKMYCNKRQNMSFRPITISNDFDLVPFFNCYTPPRKMVKYNPYRSNFRSFQEPNFETMFDQILPYSEKSKNGQSFYKKVESLPKYVSDQKSHKMIKSKIIDGQIKIILPENVEAIQASEKPKEIEDAVD